MAEGEALARPAPPPPRARAGRRRGARSASGGRPRRRAGAPRSRLIRRAWAPRSGSTPPTTLVPPPKGTTAMPSRGADVEHAAHRVGVGGQHDRVGRRLEAAAAQPRQVGVAAAGGVAQPVLVPSEDRLRADRLDQRRAAAARPPAARSPPARAPAARARSSPIRSRSTASASASSSGAIAGSPHPHHFESRRGALMSLMGARLASRSRQRPLDPVERLVEDRALAAAHHRRAEPRHPLQRLHRAEVDLGPAVLARAARSRPASCAGGARTACPPAPAPRRSARPRPS